VLAAEQDLVSANAKIGIAKAAFFPSISLTGLLGFASNDLSTLSNRDAADASIGVGLLGPIFSGGKLRGRVREAEAYQRELLIKYRQTVQTALADVDDALVFNAKAAESALRGDKQIDTLKQLAHLAQVRYDGGQSDYLEVLTAERDLYHAEIQQVNRRRDTYLALIAVYAAMGGGWMEQQDKLRAAVTSAAAPPASARAATASAGSGSAMSAAVPAQAQAATKISERHMQ